MNGAHSLLGVLSRYLPRVGAGEGKAVGGVGGGVGDGTYRKILLLILYKRAGGNKRTRWSSLKLWAFSFESDDSFLRSVHVPETDII